MNLKEKNVPPCGSFMVYQLKAASSFINIKTCRISYFVSFCFVVFFCFVFLFFLFVFFLFFFSIPSVISTALCVKSLNRLNVALRKVPLRNYVFEQNTHG